MNRWLPLLLLLGSAPSALADGDGQHCQERSARLEVDLDDDGTPEIVSANACTREVTIDGRTVRPIVRARDVRSPGAFRLRQVQLQPSGQSGVEVLYSNEEWARPEAWPRLAEFGCTIFLGEDDVDRSRCFTNAAAYRLDSGWARRGTVCDSSATLDADLDGDGTPEHIALDGCSGALRVGDHEVALPTRNRSSYLALTEGTVRGLRSTQLPGVHSLSTIALVPGEHTLRVERSYPAPNESGEVLTRPTVHFYRYTATALTLFRGGQGVPSFDTIAATEDAFAPHALGDGILHVPQQDTELCNRAIRQRGERPPRLVRAQSAADLDRTEAAIHRFDDLVIQRSEVQFTIDADTGRFRNRRRVSLPGDSIHCGEALMSTYGGLNAACPYVYTETTGDNLSYQGEILRNLRRPELETWQSLEVEVRSRSELTVVLTEEKPETTYLDAIALELDGERRLPLQCESEAPPAYCDDDGHYFVLPQGQRLELTFEGPGDAEALLPAILHADGHYIPE